MNFILQYETRDVNEEMHFGDDAITSIPKVVTVTTKYLQCTGSFTVSDRINACSCLVS